MTFERWSIHFTLPRVESKACDGRERSAKSPHPKLRRCLLPLLLVILETQRKRIQRLLRCERYRAIAGIHSQENRRIYRQFDVGTFGDECAAESFCGAKVSEPD